MGKMVRKVEGIGEVQKELELRLARAGTYRALAAELGCEFAFLNKVMHGKRLPTMKVLEQLGFERVLWYRRVFRG